MVEETVAVAEHSAPASAVLRGVGRAAIVAALVSALVMAGLVALLRYAAAHIGQSPDLQTSLFYLFVLSLFVLPGLCAGLAGNWLGCGLGSAVGSVTGGLWVLYRLYVTAPSKMDSLSDSRHDFGAYLAGMLGGRLPEGRSNWDFSYGSELRGYWNLILLAGVTNAVAAAGIATLLRRFRSRKGRLPAGAPS